MIKNHKKEKVLKNFVFEYRGFKFNIDIQKLKNVVEILHIKINEEDLVTNENFGNFLKRNNLLVREFLEYISKS